MTSLILINTDSQILLGLFILGSKFGVSQAFNLAYYGNIQIFPVNIVASSIGYCNIFARMSTIFAPFIAELKPEYISEWTFVATCCVALISGLSIRKPTNQTQI